MKMLDELILANLAEIILRGCHYKIRSRVHELLMSRGTDDGEYKKALRYLETCGDIIDRLDKERNVT